MDDFYVIIKKRRFRSDLFLSNFSHHYGLRFTDDLDYADWFSDLSACSAALRYCQSVSKDRFQILRVCFIPIDPVEVSQDV